MFCIPKFLEKGLKDFFQLMFCSYMSPANNLYYPIGYGLMIRHL